MHDFSHWTVLAYLDILDSWAQQTVHDVGDMMISFRKTYGVDQGLWYEELDLPSLPPKTPQLLYNNQSAFDDCSRFNSQKLSP